MTPIVGIDTGGTFTDFVLIDADHLRVHKVLSTPDAPERAIITGLRDLGCVDHSLLIVHGSTIATNAVLEGKGARTALITNRGFADLLTIGRQAREHLYDLQPQPRPPPVPPDLCWEVGGRLSGDGTMVEDLSAADIEYVRRKLQRFNPESVAVVLLFSFIDNGFERRLAEALGGKVFVSCSGQVLAERGEYERGITTWLNAYVGPLVQGYLARLKSLLGKARIAIMQSSATTCDSEHAGRFAVNLLLSGPAGGLQGARYLAGLGGHDHIISLDMGGTSTDVALLAGDITLTSEGRLGRYPVAVPMVDMHTIGAGGGSLAYLDAGGLLQVGPESAGADPGPACYGQGNRQATVTDANVVLGRLPALAQLAGSMQLDVGLAERALAELATGLGLESAEQAALGVVRLANEHMARAVRVISVERGHDPRDYTLVAFGGAGGLHVCELAELLDVRLALVPAHAGVLSALGMLVAPRGRQLSRTLGRPLKDYSVEAIEAAFDDLRNSGRKWMTSEGLADDQLSYSHSLDLCYDGQSFTLNVPWRGLASAENDFRAAHERRYGHSLAVPLRLINVRLSIIERVHRRPDLGLVDRPAAGDPVAAVPVGSWSDLVPLWRRDGLIAGQRLGGPAIVLEAVGTTYISPGWSALVDAYGNLALSR
jgi:N-methylhydantoinase A